MAPCAISPVPNWCVQAWRSTRRRWDESAILRCGRRGLASLNTGIFAAQAILGALFHRLRTGEGQRIAVSEFGSLLHMRGIMWI